MCRDPFEALEDLIELGVDRLLTAGQSTKVPEGAILLHQLVARADGRIKIMPGSGVNAENIELILRATLAQEVHMTAGEWYQSAMEFQHPHTRLSDDPKDDYRFYATSIDKVQEIRNILDSFSA
jgi:copper homeostasis protein